VRVRRTYKVSPAAIADLEDIWMYTVENWSLEQAESYHAGIGPFAQTTGTAAIRAARAHSKWPTITTLAVAAKKHQTEANAPS
jgi:hypothetical protein